VELVTAAMFACCEACGLRIREEG